MAVVSANPGGLPVDTITNGVVDTYVGLMRELIPDRAITPDSHVFDDLGADSLTMTRFCARVRKTPGLAPVSIRDVYARPTLRALADAASPEVAVSQQPSDGVGTALEDVRVPQSEPSAAWPHAVCGVVQALLFLGYAGLASLALVHGYVWIAGAGDLLDAYLRVVAVSVAAFGASCLVPVLAKWALIGRWTAREIRLWSPAFLRWWIVKSLLHTGAAQLFVGTPLYSWYLRALGAKVGRGVVVLSKSLPVCTDLITIGDGTIVRQDCLFLGYRAVGNKIETGPVTLGERVFIGEKAILDIDTVVGDDAQLGHASALQPGERVPARTRAHGSPAVPTEIDHQRVPPLTAGRWRSVAYGFSTLAQLVLVYLPLVWGALDLVLTQVPSVPGGPLAEAAVLSAAALVVGIPLLLLAVFVVPRGLSRLVRPDRVYPLYSRQYSAQRAITTLTNRRLLTWLFGDSSYIVGYLRALGYDLSRAEQTGSNFGTEVAHGSPYHVTVGRGTMVADGLSLQNVEYSATSFRVSEVTLGARSFLGNNIAYPPDARVGDNCLLATKVMVPLDGPVRHDVGLLGSPAFEIPRTVERDASFDHLRDGPEFDRRLRAKNRYNLRSMSLLLLARWVELLLVAIVGVLVLRADSGGLPMLFAPLSALVATVWFIGVERTILRGRRLEPKLVSIYEPYFWWHERLWKVPDRYLNLFNATPAKTVVWRLLGVRIGRRVFDDGAYLTERTLTTIGDDAVLNAGSKLQAHSQEDGTFKSDHIAVGAGATLGVGAFVHYGTTIGAGAHIAADAFLMKGEQVPDRTRWVGNPAEPARTPVATR